MTKCKLTETDLNRFTGTDRYHRHWTQCLLYTDGVKHVADNGGAHWLLDAIASFQGDKRITENPMLRDMHFWKLVVKNGRGRLTCVEDAGREPVIVQDIEFTDFPLKEIEIWVERGGFLSESGWVGAFVALLPGER